MPETCRRPVGYALNVFPYQTATELWDCLRRDVLQLKALASPHEPLPIELRLSEQLLRELRPHAPALKTFLLEHDLPLVTINAFVMSAFHGQRIKEGVFLPAWHESDTRLRFTNACLDLLVEIAGTCGQPAAEIILSVSAPFGALKPATMAAVAPNILRCAEHAAELQPPCMLALEPEPGLCVETTAEVVEFFERFVPEKLRQSLGVNFDLAHQLVQFEDLAESVATLQRHRIRIAKIHVSNAVELTGWEPPASDSIYLHQVCGVDASGHKTFFALDSNVAPPPDVVRFRIHHHRPVCPPPEGTTLREVELFLLQTLPAIPSPVPAIVETYTTRRQVIETAARELAWVREKICLSAQRARL
ncbi:MAG: hypothetical protein N3B01_01645 [Verrucomicrobiae bacterium]|nr:hypothetical protein [Verrucomicrobiae bacterium]